jgi:plasmid stabilization system protein ParE
VNPVIRPRARDDIVRQFRWCPVEQDAPDAALWFVEAVKASFEQLLRMPHMGAPRELRNPALKGCGSGRVRVPHGKRDIDRILRNEA